MVIVNHFVVAFFVIVAVVVLQLGTALHFLGCRCPDEVDLGVFKNFAFFVICQLVREIHESLLGRHRKLRDFLALGGGVRFEREGGADANDIDSRVRAVAIGTLI